MGSVLIAFSGGSDSTFLLKAASDVLKNRAMAVTADSRARPKRDLDRARKLAAALDVKHIIIRSRELEEEQVANNSKQRCYFCKKYLFGRLLELARENGIGFVADGSNMDDLDRYRPGRKALEELGIRSPLMEAGLRKSDIREFSKEMGLETWNAPSQSCFLTRFPYDKKIDLQELEKVQEAETFISDLGFRQVRVRVLGEEARVEVSSEQVPRLTGAKMTRMITDKLKSLGYMQTTMDIEGYRTGSMDKEIAWTEKG